MQAVQCISRLHFSLILTQFYPMPQTSGFAKEQQQQRIVEDKLNKNESLIFIIHDFVRLCLECVCVDDVVLY